MGLEEGEMPSYISRMKDVGYPPGYTVPPGSSTELVLPGQPTVLKPFDPTKRDPNALKVYIDDEHNEPEPEAPPGPFEEPLPVRKPSR